MANTPISNEELLQKATFTTPDLGSAVSIEAADRFINLMTSQQDLLDDVRIVRHNAAKWQEAYIDFATRIARPGVEAQRLAEPDRSKPTVSFVEMSTVLIKGEVPISDEALEDALGGQNAFENTLTEGVAARFGFDVEDLLLNGDTASGDPYLALTDGWLKTAAGAGGHVVSGTGVTDYNVLFGAMFQSLPDRYKGQLGDYRFYVPFRLEQKYRSQLADRGTSYGDETLRDRNQIRWEGIPVFPVRNWPITGTGASARTKVLLTNRNNLFAGFRRAIDMETFRDPRDGATSFIVTSRVDAQIGTVDATVIATDVDAVL